MAAGSKLKNATADERRAIVARLYLRGWRQADIAKKFGVSQQTISQDLATARDEWRREAAESFAEWLAQELAKLAEVERELWRQWRAEKDTACMGLILRLIELRGRLTGVIKRDGSTVNVGVQSTSPVTLYPPDDERSHIDLPIDERRAKLAAILDRIRAKRVPVDDAGGETVAMREATPVEVARYAFENSPGYINYLQDKKLAEYEAATGAVHQEFAAVVIGSDSTPSTEGR